MQEQTQSAADMASWNWDPAPAPATKYDNRAYLVGSYLSWVDSGNSTVGGGQPADEQVVPLAYAEGYRA